MTGGAGTAVWDGPDEGYIGESGKHRTGLPVITWHNGQTHAREMS